MSCCIFHIVHTTASSETALSPTFLKKLPETTSQPTELPARESTDYSPLDDLFSGCASWRFLKLKVLKLLRFSHIAGVVWIRRWAASRHVGTHHSHVRESVCPQQRSAGSSPLRSVAFFERLETILLTPPSSLFSHDIPVRANCLFKLSSPKPATCPRRDIARVTWSLRDVIVSTGLASTAL